MEKVRRASPVLNTGRLMAVRFHGPLRDDRVPRDLLFAHAGKLPGTEDIAASDSPAHRHRGSIFLDPIRRVLWSLPWGSTQRGDTQPAQCVCTHNH
jgi:hypothetical protein